MTEWTWEQSVRWLREQPDRQRMVEASYFDDPLLGAAERFHASREWSSTRTLIGRHQGDALDLGAGRGIASFALARDGWRVSALEPDPSDLVGSGAIEALAEESGLLIRVVREFGERLPFADHSFDLVLARQVLHHARDLPALCREAFRVLRPGGRLVATREHVISRREDLPRFLESHPLHRFYGGENAFLLQEYLDAMGSAGFDFRRVLGPYDAEVNFTPMTPEQLDERCRRPLARWVGKGLARRIMDRRSALGRRMLEREIAKLSREEETPGRPFSFVAERPE